jgi:hypothetical protein
MRANEFFDLVLSFETTIWVVEVILFLVVVFALILAAEMPWWGVLGLIGAAVLLTCLVYVNVRLWQEKRRRQN